MGKATRLKRERRRSKSAEDGLFVLSAPDGELTLVLETSQGAFARRVPRALPLPPGFKPGEGAEKATHAAAAIYGLPDFIFEPALKQVGGGVREMGDGILVVDRDAVLIQVKNRPNSTEDAAKEERWIRSNVAAAVRQANGSIRQLRSGPARLRNLRGRDIEVVGEALDWLALVIVDHANPPEGLRLSDTIEGAKHPTVVLLRRDWDFLFAQLKSSYAVVEYLKRVSPDAGSCELGREAVRYYELAASDAAASPLPADPRFMGANAEHVSAPLLPQAPAGHQNQKAHAVIRIMMEDIAASAFGSDAQDVLTETSEPMRIELLSAIDHLPVSHRESIGSVILEFLEDVSQADPEDLRWRFRRVIGRDNAPQLAFGAASRFSDTVYGAFRAWVMLRHVDFCRAASKTDGTKTVGILLTPRVDGLRPWDTTCVFVEGDLALTPLDEAEMRRLWPEQDHSSTATG